MADYTGDLKKHLRKAGYMFERQGKGDHEIWYSPNNFKKKIPQVFFDFPRPAETM